MKRRRVAGSLLFAGTMIGAGILGLPYALSQSGFLGGIIIFSSGAFFAFLSTIYVAKLVYMEKREVSLFSIYRRHLGDKLGYLTLIGILISSYGAMIAYPLAIGTTFNSLLHTPVWLGVVVFLAFIGLLLSRNLGQSNKFNALVTIVLIILLVVVLVKSLPAVEIDHYLFFHPGKIFDAWGIVIFTFAGHIVIPTVLYYVKSDAKQGIRVIKIGLLLVTILYFFFFTIVTGVMGNEVTPVATTGLAGHVSLTVGLIGESFAILALLTSAFGIGISLKFTILDVLKFKPMVSLLIIILPVLALDLYLSGGGGQAFIAVLNYAGGIGSALYVGIIPALIVIKLAKFYPFPLGRRGAIISLIFYSLAILYTLFIR